MRMEKITNKSPSEREDDDEAVAACCLLKIISQITFGKVECDVRGITQSLLAILYSQDMMISPLAILLFA